MTYRRLPFLFVNGIDINAIYSYLNTLSTIETGSRMEGLFAFKDPFLSLYQYLDGLCIILDKQESTCGCKFVHNIIPIPASVASAIYNIPEKDLCLCLYPYSEIIGFSIIEIKNKATGKVIYTFSPSYMSPLIKYFAKKGFTINDKFIQKIDDLYTKLKNSRESDERRWVLFKDRLIFDNSVLVGDIYKENFDTGTEMQVIYSLNVMITVSLPIDKKNDDVKKISKKCRLDEGLALSLLEQFEPNRVWCEWKRVVNWFKSFLNSHPYILNVIYMGSYPEMMLTGGYFLFMFTFDTYMEVYRSFAYCFSGPFFTQGDDTFISERLLNMVLYGRQFRFIWGHII